MRGCHSRGPGTGPVCVRSSTVRNVKTVNLPRSAGVQLHPTSLPGGRLGPEAYRFVDWLASARQSWWQMLPLGPPDRYGSPYKARSAFAAWPGLLAEPRARVSAGEESSFRERHAAWIGDWERFAGRGAVAARRGAGGVRGDGRGVGRAAADRRGPRGHHAGGDGVATVVGPAGDGGPAVGVRCGGPAGPASPREP